MDSTALTQLELQVALPLLAGMAGIGLAYLRQRLHLQADSTAAQLDATANAAIQSAVGNFAGTVAGALAAGTMTPAVAIQQLPGYLAKTVADSVARIPLSDTALTTMLLGKVAAVAGVPVAAGGAAGVAQPPA